MLSGPKTRDRFAAACQLNMVWPFSELPDGVVQAVFDQIQQRPFAAGEVLIQQGQPSRHLLILTKGTVKVCVEQEGQDHEIARLEEGTVLGEMGLLTRTPCTATVTCVTPGSMLVLSDEHYRSLADRYPVLQSALGCLVASRLGQDAGDPLVGKILGGYRIQRCAGRGGMAIVYEARPLAGGRHVALKMMSHRFAFQLEVQKRFEREVEICRTLRHPNIARLLGCFTSFGTNFMVLEFCSGRTLHELIRRQGPLPEDRVRSTVGQLARALDYAHRRGVCHRDVKPSNIMVGPRGKVKLMDFGLAKSKVSTELTQCGAVLGTPRYMAPEQLSGDLADSRADLFALGCVVHEMLKPEPLFPGADVMSILRQQFSWSLPPAEKIRPGLSHDIYQVLQQTLAIDPTQRVLDLAELGGRWRHTGGVGRRAPSG